MEQVDYLVYETAINWCWLTIKIGDSYVQFRLHMDENSCWDFFKYVDQSFKNKLYPHKKSRTIFDYGMKDKKECPDALFRDKNYRNPEIIPDWFRALETEFETHLGWRKGYYFTSRSCYTPC